MDVDFLKKYSAPTLRIALSLVFLYFGISQLTNPAMWTGYLPEFLLNTSNPEMFIYANGTLEVILGSMMLLGFFVRFSALILGLHLIGIAATLGFTPLGIRDFGLSIATLAVFMHGEDDWCLQRKLRKRA
jgi:uncharacterized membrane protein YphA (DoxX/SURF4 family)